MAATTARQMLLRIGRSSISVWPGVLLPIPGNVVAIQMSEQRNVADMVANEQLESLKTR